MGPAPSATPATTAKTAPARDARRAGRITATQGASPAMNAEHAFDPAFRDGSAPVFGGAQLREGAGVAGVR